MIRIVQEACVRRVDDVGLSHPEPLPIVAEFVIELGTPMPEVLAAACGCLGRCRWNGEAGIEDCAVFGHQGVDFRPTVTQ
jgi:hypothetical protein